MQKKVNINLKDSPVFNNKKYVSKNNLNILGYFFVKKHIIKIVNEVVVFGDGAKKHRHPKKHESLREEK